MIGHDLIEQVGGIEKAKTIVEGAPDDVDTHVYDLEQNKYVNRDDISIGMAFFKERFIWIKDLRTAIEHHYYGRSEAKELAAYAELSQEKIEGGAMLVGDFSGARKIIDKQLESDDVKDIRNHISPRTVVWDLASGEDWSVKHG